MREFRLSPEAEADLDGIWFYVARESGSIGIASRVVENITERFWLLAQYPYLGRAATMICGPACVALRLAIMSSSIASTSRKSC